MRPTYFPEVLEYSEEKDNSKKTHELIDQIGEETIKEWCDREFPQRLETAVSRLQDEGVEIERFYNGSRRIVFLGKYQEKEVVIKVSNTKKQNDQQKQEEAIYDQAKAEGDIDKFAKIILADPSGEWVVQEKCEYVTKVNEYEDLPENLKDIPEKYGIKEIEIGEDSNGITKIVDFGQ